jgi:hypothetical protein
MEKIGADLIHSLQHKDEFRNDRISPLNECCKTKVSTEKGNIRRRFQESRKMLHISKVPPFGPGALETVLLDDSINPRSKSTTA